MEHGCFLGDHHIRIGCPSKHSLNNCLLQFNLYVKHDNVCMHEFFMILVESAVFVHTIFMTFCINDVIWDMIWWPTLQEKLVFGTTIQELWGCIGLIDGTFIKIHKPKNNVTYKTWFNGHKKICSMNNTMVVDHWSLFINLDFGYPWFYHDVTILHQFFKLHQNWHQFFVHGDEYFKYLLGRPQ